MTKPINITPQLPGDSTGGQIDARNLTTPILFDAYAGYQLVDVNNPYRLRFNIPVASIALIRRVRLSFSLLPAVFVSQTGTVSAANTGTESANHSHTVNFNTTAGSGNHDHATASTDNTATAPPNGPVMRDPGGGYMMIAPNAPVNTFFRTDQNGAAHVHGTIGTSAVESATHTHSIAGGAITLSPATALGSTGGANNATITLISPGGGSQVVVPPSPQPQPPYPGPGTDFDDLDFTQYFTKTGIYEFRITSTAIGGIIAQAQVLGTLTAA